MKIKINKVKNVKILSFLEQFQELLRDYSMKNNLEYSPKLDYVNYNNHSELLNISISDSNEQESMFKLFKYYNIILIAESKQLKMFLSIKNRDLIGYHKSEGYFSEFKNFIIDNINFENKDFDELILLD
ncbi:hypothetical protein [Flavobacterium sp. LB2P6]|uniref:hypothetical protein n=1 Tax=Flavobacterium sp. LB2P6 TaxID=3401714 RepID=UPI003AAA8313